MVQFLLPYYDWIKAFHIISVISWMAGMFYLPRLFVYHSESAPIGTQTSEVFKTMEQKLLKVIMNPAMIAAWVFGSLLVIMGGLDFGSLWAWAKVVGVLLMTGCHGWLATRVKEFQGDTNTRTGRTYRMVNEVPTVLMFVIVIAVIVRPF